MCGVLLSLFLMCKTFKKHHLNYWENHSAYTCLWLCVCVHACLCVGMSGCVYVHVSVCETQCYISQHVFFRSDRGRHFRIAKSQTQFLCKALNVGGNVDSQLGSQLGSNVKRKKTTDFPAVRGAIYVIDCWSIPLTPCLHRLQSPPSVPRVHQIQNSGSPAIIDTSWEHSVLAPLLDSIFSSFGASENFPCPEGSPVHLLQHFSYQFQRRCGVCDVVRKEDTIFLFRWSNKTVISTEIEGI